MTIKDLQQQKEYPVAMKAVHHFFDNFDIREARRLMHTMIRSALAQDDVLDKEQLRDLLFFKQELTDMIRAAAVLAKNKEADLKVQRLFIKRDVADRLQSLDFLFNDAVFDSVFSGGPPSDRDLYHTWRWFFKCLKVCHPVYVSYKASLKNKEEPA